MRIIQLSVHHYDQAYGKKYIFHVNFLFNVIHAMERGMSNNSSCLSSFLLMSRWPEGDLVVSNKPFGVGGSIL